MSIYIRQEALSSINDLSSPFNRIIFKFHIFRKFLPAECLLPDVQSHPPNELDIVQLRLVSDINELLKINPLGSQNLGNSHPSLPNLGDFL